VLITLTARETPVPGGDATSTHAPRADPAHA
jgi:hypothetical protein